MLSFAVIYHENTRWSHRRLHKKCTREEVYYYDSIYTFYLQYISRTSINTIMHACALMSAAGIRTPDLRFRHEGGFPRTPQDL